MRCTNPFHRTSPLPKPRRTTSANCGYWKKPTGNGKTPATCSTSRTERKIKIPVFMTGIFLRRVLCLPRLAVSPAFTSLGGEPSVYLAWRAQCLSRLAVPVFVPLGGPSVCPAWRAQCLSRLASPVFVPLGVNPAFTSPGDRFSVFDKKSGFDMPDFLCLSSGGRCHLAMAVLFSGFDIRWVNRGVLCGAVVLRGQRGRRQGIHPCSGWFLRRRGRSGGRQRRSGRSTSTAASAG